MSDRPTNLFIIDHDPIFRLGLSSVLGKYEDFYLIDHQKISTTVLEALNSHPLDLIILDPELPKGTDYNGWQLCQQIKQSNPNIKICLFTHSKDFLKFKKLQDSGVEGYCPKGVAVEELITLLREIVQGKNHWPILTTTFFEKNIGPATSRKKLLVSWKKSGLNQINETLTQINLKLKQHRLSRADKLFWYGRKRELLAARWLVNQLIPNEEIIPTTSIDLPTSLSLKEQDVDLTISPNNYPTTIPGFQSENALIIIDRTFKKIKQSNLNLTTNILEIDILKTPQKQELITIIVQQLGRVLDDLNFLQTAPNKLLNNTPLILQKIWRESASIFLGKYCLIEGKYSLNLEEIEDIIDEYTASVQEEILDKIPFVTELLEYLLFDNNVKINQIDYRPESPEAQQQAEIFLHNLLIGIANGIVSLILNNFAEIEEVKTKLYHKNLVSSREIAKFRNNLSWIYRQERYWEEPKNIFESQYRLLFWSEKGIEAILIHAPRQEELKQLQGLPSTVTIILETRDAFAPLLRSVVGFVGNGLVYLLTQVIGRGLGLIGRGIIQGIGNSFQETRYGKEQKQRKSKS